MVLTNKQEEALKIAIERYNHGEKYTVISGWAGTGKTTIVKHIVAALPVPKEKVCYVAFTGKAAEVLRKKGNENVCTLHHLLYDFFPKSDGTFGKTPKITLDYQLIVVDEISMVPASMMDLLFKHSCHVICLGDPGQLPPIFTDENNHLLDSPHIFFDEIMRQAQESEIIRLSMVIREGGQIGLHNGEEVKIISKRQLNEDILKWADQTLVATNNQKNVFNDKIRNLYGFYGGPKEGEKVICLRNYWDDIGRNGNPIINGTIGYLMEPREETIGIPSYARVGIGAINVINSSILFDGDLIKNVRLDKNMLLLNEETLDKKAAFKLSKFKKKLGDIVPRQFSFGYAITCHKAQGSEWDKVLVIEEKFPFDREEHKKWLYTACTRSSSKLILVQS